MLVYWLQRSTPPYEICFGSRHVAAQFKMAIKRLAEIFDNIIAYERLKLKAFEFHTPHAPTIGEQYEKIIMKGLNSLLPTGADIRVVSGFIYNDDKSISRQIDCMIVKR